MSRPARGVAWGSFEKQAPEIAIDVRRLIDRFRFALLGTMRRDGTPRISPVEIHLVRDVLMLVMLPRTRKAADVRRDDRVVLQSPITSAGDPGAEFKLRGRALVVKNKEQHLLCADIIESHSGWRPKPSWLFLAVLLEDVTYTVWRMDGTATMSRWSVEEGLPRTVLLRLDQEMGGYRFE